jgi:hypothetical protein
MKKIISIFLLCIFVFGCDYTVPLVKNPELKIDRDIIGLWTRTKENGDAEQIAVLPLSEREYLISFTSGGGKSLYARGLPFRLDGMPLVQIEWLGTSAGKPPQTDRVFQFCTWEIGKSTLEIRLINPKTVDKDIESRKKLKEAVKSAGDNPELFREPMRFEKNT